MTFKPPRGVASSSSHVPHGPFHVVRSEELSNVQCWGQRLARLGHTQWGRGRLARGCREEGEGSSRRSGDANTSVNPTYITEAVGLRPTTTRAANSGVTTAAVAHGGSKMEIMERGWAVLYLDGDEGERGLYS